MKRTCLCVVLDILGFKNIVMKNELDDIKNTYITMLNKALYHSIHQDGFPANDVSLDEINENDICDVVWFSDSIFLFSKNDTDEIIIKLLSIISWLLFETIFGLQTRLRCGISHGEIFIDIKNHIYFGQPIIDAYQLEESQEWSGGALTESANKRVEQILDTNNQKRISFYLIEYDVPLKGNKKMKTKTIDWTTGMHDYGFVWSKNRKEPSCNDWIENYSVCVKYCNTIKFHNDICRSCKKEENF